MPLHAPLLGRFDQTVDRAWDRVRGRRLPDRFFYTLTEAGNHSLIWHGVSVVLALRPLRRPEALRLSIALAIEAALVNGPIKACFRRSRPIEPVERPHRLRTPRTSSFPSGHATSAFCAAALLADGRRRRWWIPVYGLAALVGSSRVHVRIHHASDVLVGAILGTLFGLAVRRFAPLDRSVPARSDHA